MISPISSLKTLSNTTPISSQVFFQAIKDGNVQIVQEYLNNGGNANAVSEEILPFSPLFHLLYNFDKRDLSHAIFKILISHGADANARDPEDKLLLHIAIQKKSRDYVQLLLEVPRINLEATYVHNTHVTDNGETALMCAATWYDEEIFRMLLEKGANTNHIQNFKETSQSALSIALINRNLPAVQMLLKYGADPNLELRGAKTLYGIVTGPLTALYFAYSTCVDIEAWTPFYEAIVLLINHGAEIDDRCTLERIATTVRDLWKELSSDDFNRIAILFHERELNKFFPSTLTNLVMSYLLE